MTSSNGNIFRVTGPLCGEFTGPGEFPTQRPVTRSFDVFFHLRLNKRLSKQPGGWWFETPPWSLWRQCNVRLDVADRFCVTTYVYIGFNLFLLCLQRLPVSERGSKLKSANTKFLTNFPNIKQTNKQTNHTGFNVEWSTININEVFNVFLS